MRASGLDCHSLYNRFNFTMTDNVQFTVTVKIDLSRMYSCSTVIDICSQLRP